MVSEAGVDIRERFPQHSQIHEDNNPMRELIEEGIGQVVDDDEYEIIDNSTRRFLSYATTKFLDYYGSWFGLYRFNNEDDDSYRSRIVTMRKTAPTIASIKRAVAIMYGITEDQVRIVNGINNCCRVGKIAHTMISGVSPCRIGGRLLHEIGKITIYIPYPYDPTLLERVISNVVVTGVKVSIENYTI